MNNFDKIKKFEKIKWENIPDYGLYSTQLLAYMNENLISFFPDMVSLSSSMINNYVKNDIIPKPIKKKYYRDHIGTLMVVVILKELIDLDSISQGIKLQLRIMGIERAYNEFMDILEKTLKDIIKSVEEIDKKENKDLGISRENISLTYAVKAFAFQTMTREILKSNGLYDKEDMNG